MSNYYDIIYKVTNSLTNKVYIDKKIPLTVGDFYNVEIIDSDVYDLFAKLVE